MSDGSVSEYFAQQAQAAAETVPGKPHKSRRRRARLLRRVALASLACLLVVVGAIVGGGYLAVNHLVSSIHRIPGIVALDAASQPVMPANTRRSMTILLTGSAIEPAVRGGGGVDGSSTVGEEPSGLIALIHLNANMRGGAVISIPADAIVNVPGHGETELWNTLAVGGPSLLIRTVEDLTDVRIDHYSVLDFGGVDQVINALAGVNVDVPYTFSSQGFTFPAGLNHLNEADVLAYVRQPGVSEIGRELLEQNLIRSILEKLASQRLLSHFDTDYTVLHALAEVLSVDSNFSNSQIESLALRLGHLQGRDGVFVSAPTVNGSPQSGGTRPVYLNRRVSGLLWLAIRTDSVGQFAEQFPFTVTPVAPG